MPDAKIASSTLAGGIKKRYNLRDRENMPKKFLILSALISLIVSGFLILGFRKTETVKAQAAPIAAMKTRVNGYFYVPVLNPGSLKVVLLFDNPDLEGDQAGASGEYPIMPDGVVSIFDVTSVSSHFGAVEGGANWEYMADINADKTVSILDTVIVTGNYGKSGSYITDLTNVTIQYKDIKGIDIGPPVGLGPGGTSNFPACAKTFTVKKNGVPIGAYILFYAGPPPPACVPVCAPDGCNGVCPTGCTGADDPDCPGQCLDCKCATDTDCANTCAPGNGCCPGCVPQDPDCCTCSAWVNDACGPAGGCPIDQMHQTRTCAPAVCAAESQCVVDPACAPPACTWQNDACGQAPCATDKRHQTCGPAGCSGTCSGQPPGSTQCIADPVCAPPPPACTPDGCNGNCPAGCAGNPADPDCVCQADAAHCCGLGCNHLTDPDCPAFVNPLKFGSFQGLIEGIINFIFWVGVALLPLMIIIGAFYLLTSGGDPERVRKAKKIIIYACIGLVIILLARGIISIIKQVLGG